MYKFNIIIISIFLTACTSQPILIKAHSISDYDKSDIALLKPAAYIEIFSIDGNNDINLAPSQGLLIGDYEIELLPGKHVIGVAYRDGNRYSTGNLHLNIEVAKDHKYIIAPQVRDGKWKPVFKDVTSNKNCWTVRVGVIGGPPVSDC